MVEKWGACKSARVPGVCEHRQLEFPSELTLLSAAAGVGAAAGVAGQGLPKGGGEGTETPFCMVPEVSGVRQDAAHITTAAYGVRRMARGVVRWLQGRVVQKQRRGQISI